MSRSYVPDAGDLVWIDFDPHAGREQSGRRPAVVLSPAAYNVRSGLALACPVTSHTKGYPFEVALPAGGRVQGVILSDHLKSIDWRVRRAQKAGRLGDNVLEAVRDRLRVLLLLD